MENTANKMIRAYINLRGAIKEKEDQIKLLKEHQSEISARLLDICSEQDGVHSIKTNAGTASRTTRQSFWTGDWDNMYSFVKEHDVFHLLQKRIHDGNMREFLHENPDLVPKGLQSDTKYVISVRKPTAK